MICCPPPPPLPVKCLHSLDFSISSAHIVKTVVFFSLKTLTSVCVTECLKNSFFSKAFHFLYFRFIQGPPGDPTLVKECPDEAQKGPTDGGSSNDFRRRRRSVEEIQQVWCGTERKLPKKVHLEVVVCTSAIKGHFVARRRIVWDQKIKLGSITSSASSAKANFLLLNSIELRNSLL